MGQYARMLWDFQRQRIATGNRIHAMTQTHQLPEYQVLPAIDTLQKIERIEADINRNLVKLAATHPLAGWINSQRGIGLGGFARLLAITGPLDRFPTISKLWKYLGLAVVNGNHYTREEALAIQPGERIFVQNPDSSMTYFYTAETIGVDQYGEVEVTVTGHDWALDETDILHTGKALRMAKGMLASHTNCSGGTHLRTCPEGCTTDHHPNCHPDKIGNAYSPQGKTLCRQLAEAIVKVGKGGPYREAYDVKKAYYNANREWTPKHSHDAAMRYAVKCLLRDLWLEWHKPEDAVL